MSSLAEIDHISQRFGELHPKFDHDLQTRGVTIWTIKNRLGIQAVYHQNNEVTFASTVQIVNGRPVNRVLTATYRIKGYEISIVIEQETNSPYATTKVWLDHTRVIADRIDPLSQTQQLIYTLHTNDLVEGLNRKPEEFALKALNDFSAAGVDTRRVTALYNGSMADAANYEGKSRMVVKRNRSRRFL